MSSELTEKEREVKTRIERELGDVSLSWESRGRRILGLLPHDPRCVNCLAPFEGPGAAIVKMLLNKEPSTLNPLMCNSCEAQLRRLHFGAEVEMSMLFADIRGSTALAESIAPADFRNLIDRFYTKTTHVLIHSYAIIDKLAGDQVSGYYLPGIAGGDYLDRAAKAAQEILHVTGHSDPEGPWAPVGVGLHTGVAYFGAVGSGADLVELTALGDAVNIAARLASEAAAGEVVISEAAAQKAGLDTSKLEKRVVELKGKSKPMKVWVMRMISS